MSTWDDKPNDYEHALAEIERLRAEIERLYAELAQRPEDDYERLRAERDLWESRTKQGAEIIMENVAVIERLRAERDDWLRLAESRRLERDALSAAKHIISDPSLQRPDYIYNEHGIGYHRDSRPYMKWKHIDGPLIVYRDGQMHWLTIWQRLRFWQSSAETIEAVLRPDLRAAIKAAEGE